MIQDPQKITSEDKKVQPIQAIRNKQTLLETITISEAASSMQEAAKFHKVINIALGLLPKLFHPKRL